MVSQVQVLLTGPPDEIATALARYTGVGHVLFRIAALEPDVYATNSPRCRR